MDDSHGLRERKKRRTRLAIADAATPLFIAKGFEGVTLAEIARAADVSINTILNYFGTKEDLFFDRQDEVEEFWAAIVRGRGRGESVVAAVRDTYLDRVARGDPALGLAPDYAAFLRVIVGSPALMARAREIAERSEAALARALAEEGNGSADEMTARIIAAQLFATLRALQSEAQRRILEGEALPVIQAALRLATERAFALLEDGLGDYGLRSEPTHE